MVLENFSSVCVAVFFNGIQLGDKHSGQHEHTPENSPTGQKFM
jgi:hypothetical protein